jgi:hypothetical protein
MKTLITILTLSIVTATPMLAQAALSKQRPERARVRRLLWGY